MKIARIAVIALAVLVPASWTIARAQSAPSNGLPERTIDTDNPKEKKQDRKEERKERKERRERGEGRERK
jgi:hypothetical protein